MRKTIIIAIIVLMVLVVSGCEMPKLNIVSQTKYVDTEQPCGSTEGCIDWLKSQGANISTMPDDAIICQGTCKIVTIDPHDFKDKGWFN